MFGLWALDSFQQKCEVNNQRKIIMELLLYLSHIAWMVIVFFFLNAISLMVLNCMLYILIVGTDL